MPSSRILIASNTLSTSAATVTFSGIPATYTDLVLRGSTRTSDTGAYLNYISFGFNGNTSSLYSATRLIGNSSTATSDRDTSATSFDMNGLSPTALTTSNTFSSFEIYIPSYTASQNKPLGAFGVAENNSSTADQSRIQADAGLFRSTTAISSITLTSGVNFVTGSSFYLYGVKSSGTV
jgi:hypothetical protein